MAGLPPSESLSCSACNTENRADARFCGSCGAKLTVSIACGSCGATNLAGQRFCDECGVELSGAPAATPISIVEMGEQDERKQVTVLFADVRGSMELAGQVSAERLREIMNGLFTRLAAAVTHFDGTVDKFTGDGIMAVFGAPVALEDHALRACLAAAEMREAATAIADDLLASDGIDLALRVGLNSGEAVVGSIGSEGSQAYTAVGHAVGLAQRVESLSEPGGVWMSETTARQISDQVTVEDAGEHTVKGVNEPLRLFRLLEVGEEAPIQSPRTGRQDELVGRADELAELLSAVDRLESGTGSLIGIVGSPGLGKSRLCSELVDHCDRRGLPVFSTRCQSHTRDVSLNPLLRLFRAFFAIDSTEPPEVSRQKVAERLLIYDRAFESALPIVYDFIGIADPDLSLPELSADARKRRLLAAIGQISRARTDPVVLLVEDLHWSDPESQAFFDVLAESTADSKTLFIGTFRPEFRGDLLSRPFYRQIPLAPLRETEIQEMLNSMIGNDPSADGLAEMVAARCGGNPFFAKEIVRDLAETRAIEGRRGDYRLATSIGSIATPSSVQAVLGARIDRLDATSKAVLMTASVIGDEFRYDLLAETVEIATGELASALHELIQSEFVKETELFPVSKYSFRHPLTHEVAYESQLTPVRARIHERIAVAMQSIDLERLDENAAIVAQHYEAAGDALNAAIWHARAASWAMTTDPIAAYESWWRVKRLSKQAIDEGLEANAIYAGALWMLLATGWRNGADRSLIEPIFEEACAIAARDGDDDYLARVYAAYSSSAAFVNGDFREAARLGAEARLLSSKSEDRLVRLVGMMSQPYAALNVGRFAEAVAGSDEVIAEVTDDPDYGSYLLGASPAAFFYGTRGVALAELGRCAEARESQANARRVAEQYSKVTQTWTHIYNFWAISLGRDAVTAEVLRDVDDAFALGDEVGDVFTRSTVYICGGAVYLRAGDVERAFEILELATEFFDGTVAIKNTEMFLDQLRGEALCELGDFEAGLQLTRRAVEGSDESGYAIGKTGFRLAHAGCLIRNGGPAALANAARELRDAERLLATSEQKLEYCSLHRVRGELFKAKADLERADQERHAAIAAAREMDARGLLALLGEPVPAG